jgi:hypothetical protein
MSIRKEKIVKEEGKVDTYKKKQTENRHYRGQEKRKRREEVDKRKE